MNERKNLEVMFLLYFFTDGKQHESREVDMITLGNHALRSYTDMITRDLDIISRDLDMIIV